MNLFKDPPTPGGVYPFDITNGKIDVFCYFFACGALLRPCFRRLQIRYVSDLFSRIKIKRFRFYFWTKTNFRFIDDLWWDLSTNQLRCHRKCVVLATETLVLQPQNPRSCCFTKLLKSTQILISLIFLQIRLISLILLKHPPPPQGGGYPLTRCRRLVLVIIMQQKS